MPATDTIQHCEEHNPTANEANPRPPLNNLERRLVEAFDQLWDNFVDPSEAIYDADGAAWNRLNAGRTQASGCAAGVPFCNEQQLAQIRAECRTLAAGNEFAINGHD
jgi:hypothetical protein